MWIHWPEEEEEEVVGILGMRCARCGPFVALQWMEGRKDIDDPLESDTHIDANSLDPVAVLRWIGFGQVSVEFLIVLVPFNRIQCLAGLVEFLLRELFHLASPLAFAPSPGPLSLRL